jgi:hypothetical protein
LVSTFDTGDGQLGFPYQTQKPKPVLLVNAVTSTSRSIPKALTNVKNLSEILSTFPLALDHPSKHSQDNGRKVQHRGAEGAGGFHGATFSTRLMWNQIVRRGGIGSQRFI